MSAFADRLMLLQLGAELIPHGQSVLGGSTKLYWEPVYGVLVEAGGKWYLFDTGLSREAVDSETVQDMYRRSALAFGSEPDAPEWLLRPSSPDPSSWAWAADGDPLVTALASVGLQLADLEAAMVSHLHLDHTGGIRSLSDAGVPIIVHRADRAAVRAGAGAEVAAYRPDWEHPATVWEETDGDLDVAPGLRLLATPGHTAGHMSLQVDLRESGTWLFAADAADLGQVIYEAAPCGSTQHGTPEEYATARSSTHRLLAIAAETDGRIIPGHDQVVLNAVRHPRGGHR